MNIQLNSGDVLFGGHVMSGGNLNATVADFVGFANQLKDSNSLVKFGRLQPKDGGQDRIVLRVASAKLDGLVACDTKNPLYRTDDTKAVNNDVRRTFLKALSKEYPKFDVANLLDGGDNEKLLEDFVGKRGVEMIRHTEGSYSLKQLMTLMNTHKTGKPISGRDIINIVQLIDPKDERKVKRFGENLESRLYSVLTSKDEEAIKISQIKSAFTYVVNELSEKDREGFKAFMDELLPKLNSLDLKACLNEVAPKVGCLDNPFIMAICETCVKVQEEVQKIPEIVDKFMKLVMNPRKEPTGKLINSYFSAEMRSDNVETKGRSIVMDILYDIENDPKVNNLATFNDFVNKRISKIDGEALRNQVQNDLLLKKIRVALGEPK